ncbi:FmdB family zinc ribbon protein [Brevibacillus sp. B_LB10_24]
MPKYQFCCAKCGDFDLWLGMAEAAATTICPVCDGEAARVYTPPGLMMTPYSLRRRIEGSAEPKVVKREQHHHGHHHQHAPSRPWQAGH